MVKARACKLKTYQDLGHHAGASCFLFLDCQTHTAILISPGTKSRLIETMQWTQPAPSSEAPKLQEIPTGTGQASEVSASTCSTSAKAGGLHCGLAMVVPAHFKSRFRALVLYLRDDKAQLRKMVEASAAEQMLRNQNYLPAKPSQSTACASCTAGFLLHCPTLTEHFHGITSLRNGHLQSKTSGREGRSRKLLLPAISERQSNHLGAEHLSAAGGTHRHCRDLRQVGSMPPNRYSGPSALISL